VPTLEVQLVGHLEVFTAFARKRTRDEDLAREVVQVALVKALERADDLRDEERAVAWFYRILRNALVDLHRGRTMEPLDEEPVAPAVIEEVACACFRELLPGMKPEYAQLIERLDLGEESPADVAAQLGITPNNLKVRRHRARKQLRARLEDLCRLCARHGCLDCTC